MTTSNHMHLTTMIDIVAAAPVEPTGAWRYLPSSQPAVTPALPRLPLPSRRAKRAFLAISNPERFTTTSPPPLLRLRRQAGRAAALEVSAGGWRAFNVPIAAAAGARRALSYHK